MTATIKSLLERFSDRKKFFFPIAYELAQKAHKYQKRKDGQPYMSHVDAVILRSFEEADISFNDRIVDIIITIAALHDAEEDHPHNFGRGLYIGVFETERGTSADFDSDIFVVVDALSAITKLPKERKESYTNYVLRVKKDRWARFVKNHDLDHNMSDLEYGNLLQKYQLTKYVLNN